MIISFVLLLLFELTSLISGQNSSNNLNKTEIFTSPTIVGLLNYTFQDELLIAFAEKRILIGNTSQKLNDTQEIAINTTSDRFMLIDSDTLTKKVFVFTEEQSIREVDIQQRTLGPKIPIKHPYIAEFMLNNMKIIVGMNNNYIIGTSRISPEVLFLNLEDNKPIFLRLSEEVLGFKDIVVGSTKIILVESAMTSFIILDKDTREFVNHQTDFTSNDNSLSVIASVDFIQFGNYFMAATGDESHTNSIFLFDSDIGEGVKVKEFGTLPDHLEMMKQVPNTLNFFTTSIRNSYMINIYTGAKIQINMPEYPIAAVDFSGRGEFMTMMKYTNITFYDFKQQNAVCHLGCKTCDGMGYNNCTSCNPGYNFNQAKKACEEKCPDGAFYLKDTDSCQGGGDVPIPDGFMNNRALIDNYTIDKLDSSKNCGMYSWLGAQCLKCTQDIIKEEGKVVVDNQCKPQVEKCPTGSFKTEKYPFCAKCPSNCQSCMSVVNKTHCLVCEDGMHTVFGPNTCIKAPCPAGFYYSSRQAGCVPCYKGCLSCYSNEESSCQLCAEGFYNVGGACRLSCPYGFLPNFVDNSCKPCREANCAPCNGKDFGKHVYQNKCFDKCPEGTGTFDFEGEFNCFDCYDAKCKYLLLNTRRITKATTGLGIRPDDEEKQAGQIPTAWILATFGMFQVLLCSAFVCYCLCGGCKCLRKKKAAETYDDFDFDEIKLTQRRSENQEIDIQESTKNQLKRRNAPSEEAQ